MHASTRHGRNLAPSAINEIITAHSVACATMKNGISGGVATVSQIAIPYPWDTVLGMNISLGIGTHVAVDNG